MELLRQFCSQAREEWRDNKCKAFFFLHHWRGGLKLQILAEVFLEAVLGNAQKIVALGT